MSASFTLLFFKQFALPRTAGGIVLAQVLVPGIARVDTTYGGMAGVQSRVAGCAAVSTWYAGLAFYDLPQPGIAKGQASHQGLASGSTVVSGLRSATRHIDGIAGAQSLASGLAANRITFPGFQLTDHIHPGFRRAGVFQEDEQMSVPQDFDVTWREDGTATVLGRLTWRSGSGAATGVKGEGNWAEQADLSSITYSVYDQTSNNELVGSANQTVTVSAAVIDTPVTSTALWTLDTTGYNFIHDLPPASFPIGGHIYCVEYKFTFTGGSVGWGVFRGEAKAVLTS